MADIHILTGDGRHWTIVFHFPVPDQNNTIGTNYRTALINSGLGGTSQMAQGNEPGQITTTELAQIEAGELYEHSMSLPAESGATTNAQILAFIRAMYARYETTVIAALQQRLKYYGYTAAKE